MHIGGSCQKAKKHSLKTQELSEDERYLMYNTGDYSLVTVMLPAVNINKLTVVK